MTLCVAVVVLSLVSVGQSASLACELLLQPVVQGLEVTGRLYLIDLSSNYCWATALLNFFLIPTVHMDVTSTGKPHYYDVNFKLKISEFCDSKTIPFFYKDNKIAEASTVSCRRPNITAEEMKGFEAQAECLSLYRPQVLNSDHNSENCKPMENAYVDSVEFNQSISGRVRNLFSELFT